MARPFCCSLFLLLRAQKKKQEKGTPTSPGPAGFPYFSPRAGRGKTRASPSNSSRVFSAPVCEARQDKWGEENSHWHAAEHRRGCRKRALHCLRRSRVCKAPAASRSTGHPAFGGTRDTGCPFFGSFLWASKEMNGSCFMLQFHQFEDESSKSSCSSFSPQTISLFALDHFPLYNEEKLPGSLPEKPKKTSRQGSAPCSISRIT